MHAGQVKKRTSLVFFHSSLNDQQFEALRNRFFFGTRFLRLKSSSVSFFDSELLVEGEIDFLFEVQEEGEEPPPYGKVRSPVANTFSTLSNLKSTLNRSFQVGIIQKESAKKQHIPITFGRFGTLTQHRVQNPDIPFFFRGERSSCIVSRFSAFPA